MNIIEINKENILLEDGTYRINVNVDELNVKINGNVCIYDYNKTDNLNLNIEVLDNSTLKYYMYSNNDFDTKNIVINNSINSKTVFNYSMVTTSDSYLNINNNIIGDNVDSNIKVRAVAKKDACVNIDSNGYVEKSTKNSVFSEDLRGLNIDNGSIKINPNMFIDTDDTIANHNSTISNINNDYLFYLNTKGIDNKDARKLIVNGFIKSILNEEFKL